MVYPILIFIFILGTEGPVWGYFLCFVVHFLFPFVCVLCILGALHLGVHVCESVVLIYFFNYNCLHNLHKSATPNWTKAIKNGWTLKNKLE